MSTNQVLLLSRTEMASLVDMRGAIEVVAAAFTSHASGAARLFPMVREPLETPDNAVFGIKSGRLDEEWVGLKAAGSWPSNAARGIAAHQAAILLMDAKTGVARLLCDGNYVTTIRTAAAGAVALQHLAPENVERAAVIGAGVQGAAQAQALAIALPSLRSIHCYDPDASKVDNLAAGVRELRPDISVVNAATPELAVRGARVVVTCTPGRELCVRDEWIEPGTHISAFGADTAGKQELEPTIVRRAKVVVDDLAQALMVGEMQHQSPENGAGVYCLLGDLTAGRLAGRVDDHEVTVFDATGIAIQDLAVARLALKRALELGLGTTFRMDL